MKFTFKSVMITYSIQNAEFNDESLLFLDKFLNQKLSLKLLQDGFSFTQN